MIRLLDRSKIGWFNYFYIFCMLIYAGNATVFVRQLGDLSTIGNAFGILITIFFWFKNKIRLGQPYYISIAVFLFYAIITSVNNKMINPRWITEWIIWLTMAYGICQAFKERLFVVVESVLYQLCIIALVFWGIHLIIPDEMPEIVKAIQFSKPYEEECNVYANMIFYTVNSMQGSVGEEFRLFLRNAGFAWEPGAFSCMICLGIFSNILRTNFSLRNRSLWVFLLALLSTQSTTGLSIMLLLVVAWLILNKKYRYLFLVVPVVIAAFNLPFVKDKIIFEIEISQYKDISDSYGAQGRLFSLQLDFEEFLRHPIIGLGGYSKGTWLAQNGYEIATISGIGNMLVTFGAIMTALFIGLLIKSCQVIQSVVRSNNAWFLLIVILGMMFSYGLWKQPIFIAFWMFGVYCSEIVSRKGVLNANNSIVVS